MRVYISGPMTGHAACNAPLFADAATWATAQGWEPVNPHDVRPTHEGFCPEPPMIATLDGAETHAYGCFIRADLRALLGCDAIVMLPGWQYSRGARMEHEVAAICGMPVHHFEPAAVA